MIMRQFLSVRIYREDDVLTDALHLLFDAVEGLPYVNCVAGQLVDAMHDQSGVRYGYTVAPAAHPASIALGPLLTLARGRARP